MEVKTCCGLNRNHLINDYCVIELPQLIASICVFTLIGTGVGTILEAKTGARTVTIQGPLYGGVIGCILIPVSCYLYTWGIMISKCVKCCCPCLTSRLDSEVPFLERRQ